MLASMLELKAYLARFTPALTAVATPFLIGLIKHKRPDWKEKYREQWPYIAAGLGVTLNLCGLAIAPDILFADASGVTSVDAVSSVAASASVGYLSGLGAAKQRDLTKKRKLCPETPVHPPKKAAKKPSAKGRKVK